MWLHLQDETLKTKANSIANTKLWNCVSPRETKLGSHNRHRHRRRRRHPRQPRPAHLIRLKSISPGAVDVAMRFEWGNWKGGREWERGRGGESKTRKGALKISWPEIICRLQFQLNNCAQFDGHWREERQRTVPSLRIEAIKGYSPFPSSNARPSRVHFSTSVATFPIETWQRQRERNVSQHFISFSPS